MLTTPVTPEMAVEILRQLPPREVLQVIAKVLPDVVDNLSDRPKRLRSWRGVCAHLGTAPSADDIDQVRREVWANFPRDDI